MLSPAAPWDSNSRKMSTLFMKKVTCWAFVKCVDGTSVFKIRGFRTATEIFSRERLAEVGGERGQEDQKWQIIQTGLQTADFYVIKMCQN